MDNVKKETFFLRLTSLYRPLARIFAAPWKLSSSLLCWGCSVEVAGLATTKCRGCKKARQGSVLSPPPIVRPGTAPWSAMRGTGASTGAGAGAVPPARMSCQQLPRTKVICDGDRPAVNRGQEVD